MMEQEEKNFRITELMAKSMTGVLTEEERQELVLWIAESGHHRDLCEKWTDSELIEEKSAAYRRLEFIPAWEQFRIIRKQTLIRRRRQLTLRFARYAALFLLPLALAVLLLMDRKGGEADVTLTRTAIKAGQSQAILTLSSGERRMLNVGELRIEDLGATMCTDSGKISYAEQKTGVGGGGEGYHTLEVPRGGEYFVVLGDGTNVWLNSDTRLKFPVVFGDSIRRVYLEGEAFFRVSPDRAHPFVVETRRAMIKVVGTSFNVCSYDGEEDMLTTLEEGVVEVQAVASDKALRMAPGEQVRLTQTGRMEKYDVDLSLFTSWKSGRLVFKDMRLEDLLHNLSRWYDVDIYFRKEALKRIVFTGDIKKYEDLNEVLEMIELTSEARFMVEGKKITVY